MNTFFAWMADLGIQLDDHQPDARQRAHLAAIREARREADRGSSRLSRLARWLGSASTRPAAQPATCSCPA
ncbi:MAG TPA: hypothetical protein VFW02_09175 [Candidatus Limnocylindrales bacterium]|nr:hypothetical protein [Candidatus Limnocylindrales bacterium]